jgi:N-acetylneuraminate synthase
MVKIIAEIGINHNGSIKDAIDMIKVASEAGCDYVKFQKRTPDICVPEKQKGVMKDTPWGQMTYLEYRHRVEFGHTEYGLIDSVCADLEIGWFASCWDIPSVEFMSKYAPDFYKIPSAMLTNESLIKYIDTYCGTIILSTGMSTAEEIMRAGECIVQSKVIVFHCVSSYPCQVEDVNLKQMLRYDPIVVGYSGHEEGFVPTLASVALGAEYVERHITLNKRMWGSDQFFSLEPGDLKQLTSMIREVEACLGHGDPKTVLPCEESSKLKLRS